MIGHLRQFRKSILFLAKTIVLGSLVLIFYYVWKNQYYSTEFFYIKGTLLLSGLYAALLLTFTYVYNATKYGIQRLLEIIYSYLLAFLITNTLIYIVMILIARETLPIFPLLQMTCLQFCVAAFYSYLINKLYFLLYPPRKLLVIRSVENDPLRLLKKILQKKERYEIKAVLSEELPIEYLKDAIREYECTLLCNVCLEKRASLLDFCAQHKKRVYITPTTQDIIIKNSNSTQVFDIPLYYAKNQGLSTENLFLKRIMDIFISLIGLILTSPILLITACLIKLEDKGPALFHQKRLTKDGKTFNLIKFRSMIIDAEKSGAQLAQKNDQRITKIGHWIRKLRIDELPQLFNILKGDMSIVGPRPERPEIASQYEEIFPDFRLRLTVKAGLTGWAQIYGKYNTTPWDKLLMDLMYIESYSILLDIRLLFLTVKILFMSESTEGIDEGETTAL